MPKLTIDGIEINVDPGKTVLQACEKAKIEIPRFCYHKRLSIAGNCRMCLVEVERSPKPVAACAMPAGDGMVIHTNTKKVRDMRKAVMEFLLINHPLDCPICDQGGECDLQDMAMAYGSSFGRFAENKRAVIDKDFGPLVKGVMTRCIHCTRCIRFADEIAGVSELGGIGRGEYMEIDTYIDKALHSELSGCLVDLCPVGALISRPYEFRARPWELTKIESIDVLDALGSAIRIDVRDSEILRILPRLNEKINEEWLGDKSRAAIDGLKHCRLDRPYIKDSHGNFCEASWEEAFEVIAKRVKGLDGSKIAAIAGDLCDAESMMALKDLMNILGSTNIDCRQDGARLDASCRAGYIFNSTIAGIDEADAILLVGTNPRKEAPVLNARIRKRYLTGQLRIGVIGDVGELTYDYQDMGNDPSLLTKLDARHPFGKIIKEAKKPMIIIGMSALARPDGAAILAVACERAEKLGVVRADSWNGFNILHTAAARVGGLDLGFLPGNNSRDVAGILDGAKKGKIELVYLLGADEIDTTKLSKAFVIYQGHHGDAGVEVSDVILPGAAYTEKEGTYVNTEGRVQRSYKATFPPGNAKEDWTILRALSEALGCPLPYDSLDNLRTAMAKAYPVFAQHNEIEAAEWSQFGIIENITLAPIKMLINNYYMTDPISRASETMALCMAAFGVDRKEEKT